jgi:hypothetical protein
VVSFRLRPGEQVPWDGQYRLVGHYGEQMDVTATCRAGESLPLVATEGEDEVWFVWDPSTEAHIEAA